MKQQRISSLGFRLSLTLFRHEFIKGLDRTFRRMLDICGSLLGFLMCLPIFSVLALCIKLNDGGPIFYIQTRIGDRGRPFPFPKFRSMQVNADQLVNKLQEASDRQDGVTFKMRKDPRVTWIGRIMRRWSLDELPQLWSVFIGDMAIVGPRPALPREVAQYSAADRLRLLGKPGLTCTWQVSGRADLPFEDQLRLDVDYLHERSFSKDMHLIMRTIPAVISGKGAY